MTQKISIGGLTIAALLTRLAEQQIKLNPLAEQLLTASQSNTSKEAFEVEIVTVSVASLGFNKGVTFADLAARAHNQGLSLCPVELAPYLRLQLTNQPKGLDSSNEIKHKAPSGAITVASTPPVDDQDVPWGFYLRRIEGALWLRGYKSWSGHLWAPEDVFVFMRADKDATINNLVA